MFHFVDRFLICGQTPIVCFCGDQAGMDVLFNRISAPLWLFNYTSQIVTCVDKTFACQSCYQVMFPVTGHGKQTGSLCVRCVFFFSSFQDIFSFECVLGL